MVRRLLVAAAASAGKSMLPASDVAAEIEEVARDGTGNYLLLGRPALRPDASAFYCRPRFLSLSTGLIAKLNVQGLQGRVFDLLRYLRFAPLCVRGDERRGMSRHRHQGVDRRFFTI